MDGDQAQKDEGVTMHIGAKKGVEEIVECLYH